MVWQMVLPKLLCTGTPDTRLYPAPDGDDHGPQSELVVAMMVSQLP